MTRDTRRRLHVSSSSGSRPDFHLPRLLNGCSRRSVHVSSYRWKTTSQRIRHQGKGDLICAGELIKKGNGKTGKKCERSVKAKPLPLLAPCQAFGFVPMTATPKDPDTHVHVSSDSQQKGSPASLMGSQTQFRPKSGSDQECELLSCAEAEQMRGTCERRADRRRVRVTEVGY